MFGIRRCRTTEEASLKTFAGDRPPRYGMGRFLLRVGRGPVPRHAPVSPKNVRGGQAPALRYGVILAARRARAWFMFGIRRCRTTEESFPKNVRGGQAPARRYTEMPTP